MHKVLLATTALVASASIAAAEVSLSGFAEMGVVGGDDIETQFHSDFDVTFTLSGETDTGLTFGATIDLDEVGDDADAAGADPIDARGPGEEHSVFVSGAFGTLTMGDTDGALDWALTEVDIGGAIDDAHTAHTGFNGNAGLDGQYDGQVARYDYSFGDFGAAVSFEIDDSGVGDAIIGVGGKYSADLGGIDLGFGLGFQQFDNNAGVDASLVGLSVSAGFGGGFQAIVNYTQGEATVGGVDFDPTHVAIGVGYTMDALTVGVNYGEYEDWVLNADPDTSGFGLAVNYDLGGGAVLQAGYGSSDDGTDTTDAFSLGIALSF